MAKLKIKWPYKTDAPQNREWNKDRKKLFAKNGNGWWVYNAQRGLQHLSDFDKRYIDKRHIRDSDSDAV